MLTDFVSQGKIAIVLDDKKVCGVITKIDLITYLSEAAQK